MERTYTIPLRKAFLKTPIYVRTNRAVREVRKYLQKHMKTEDVRLGEELNKALWARGDSKPPSRVTVNVKMEENTAYAELQGHEFKKKDFSATEEPEQRGLPTATPAPAKKAEAPTAEPTEEKVEKPAPAKKTPAKAAKK
jgi:large subunit ribosomal protein L31e